MSHHDRIGQLPHPPAGSSRPGRRYGTSAVLSADPPERRPLYGGGEGEACWLGCGPSRAPRARRRGSGGTGRSSGVSSRSRSSRCCCARTRHGRHWWSVSASSSRRACCGGARGRWPRSPSPSEPSSPSTSRGSWPSMPPAWTASPGCSSCPTPCCAGGQVARLPSDSASSSSGYPSPSRRSRPRPRRWSPVTASSCSRPRWARQSATAPAAASARSSRCGCASATNWPASCTTRSGIASRRSPSRRRQVARCRLQIPSARWPPWSPSRRRRPGRWRRCGRWWVCCATERTPIWPPAGAWRTSSGSLAPEARCWASACRSPVTSMPWTPASAPPST